MVMFLDQFVQWVIAPLFAALLQHLVAMVPIVSSNQSSVLHLAHTLNETEVVRRLSGGCKGTTKQNLTNNTMTWIVMPMLLASSELPFLMILIKSYCQSCDCHKMVI